MDLKSDTAMKEIMELIEEKIINLIDVNEKLVKKIQHLQHDNEILQSTNNQLIHENNDAQQKLERLLLTITEVEDVINQTHLQHQSFEI